MRHSVLFATAFATLISTQTFAADLPGKGITVNPVQSTITEETFQTLLVSRALEKLGYRGNLYGAGDGRRNLACRAVAGYRWHNF